MCVCNKQKRRKPYLKPLRLHFHQKLEELMVMLELESPIADMIPFIVAKTYDVAQRGHVLDADRVRVRVEAAPTPQDGHA